MNLYLIDHSENDWELSLLVAARSRPNAIRLWQAHWKVTAERYHTGYTNGRSPPIPDSIYEVPADWASRERTFPE